MAEYTIRVDHAKTIDITAANAVLEGGVLKLVVAEGRGVRNVGLFNTWISCVQQDANENTDAGTTSE